MRGLLMALIALALLPGTAGALPYHEVTEPEGEPRGTMFVIHGGSWVNTGPALVEARRPDAARWAAAGWRVYNIDYRAGAASITDVIAFYDHVRGLYPADRICAYGESAGGHLALMMAARRPGLECVLTDAAPTDLTDANGHGTTMWFPAVYTPGYSSFGPDTRPESPTYLAVTARQHVAFAPNDNWIPRLSQADRYRTRHPEATVRAVQTFCPCVRYIHSDVNAADLARLREEQAAFAATAPEPGPVTGGAAAPEDPVAALVTRLLR
jgi:hypothetical protein